MSEYPPPLQECSESGLPVVHEDEEENEEHGIVGEEEMWEESEESEESMEEMSEADTAERVNSSAEEAENIEKYIISSSVGDQPKTGKKAQRTNRAEVKSDLVKSVANVTGKKGKPIKMVMNEQSEDACNAEADEGDEEEDGDDAVQMALHIAEKALKFLLAVVKAIFGLLMGIFGLVRRTMGPLVGAALFALVAYLIGTYSMSPVLESDVPNFEARLKFLLRCQVWPTLPVFLAALAGIIRKNEVHKTFARDVFEQALLSLFNLLLLATHIDHEYLMWVGACAITGTIFSLLHWFCLVYTRRPGSIFALPNTLLNFVVMAYNIYIIFGQDLGYVPIKTEQDLSPMRSGSQGKTGWFF